MVVSIHKLYKVAQTHPPPPCFVRTKLLITHNVHNASTTAYIVSSVVVSTRQALEKSSPFHYSSTTVPNNVICRAIIDALLGPSASMEQ